MNEDPRHTVGEHDAHGPADGRAADVTADRSMDLEAGAMLARLPAAKRRRLLGAMLSLPAAAVGAAALPRADLPEFPVVRPGVDLVFPRDFGAHPDYRTEWWYVTGWLQPAAGDATRERLGFQVTFFRSRPAIDPRNPSRFAARELVLAHLAISDARLGALKHDQRTARAGFDLAGSRTTDTDVWIDDWRLDRRPVGGQSRYRALFPGDRLGLELVLDATQPVLLHGKDGFSQKGPQARQASYYYTEPHLAVGGRIVREGRALAVRGTAWLDHEWSSEYLAAGSVGWDWAGLNFDDGSALMAFRMRDRNGNAVWAGGTWRDADGRQVAFDARSVRFTALRRWRSARTGAVYPVAMRIEVMPTATPGSPVGAAAPGAGGATRVTGNGATGAGPAFTVELVPLFDDQELDARASTGIVYWEGAVTAMRDGVAVARGYLELTGYHGALSI